MKQVILLSMIFIFAFFMCKKDPEDEKLSYSFNSVVDSTFYCSVMIEEKYHKFSDHVNMTGWRSEARFKDSILVGYFFNYVDSTTGWFIDKFSIKISKMFLIKDLKYKTKIGDTYYSTGKYSKEEFLSVFQQPRISFSTPFVYRDECLGCDSTAGASIIFDESEGNFWATSFASRCIQLDTIGNFYKYSNFTIINLKILDDSHFIIEGKFDVRLFNRYHCITKQFSNGYFKGYQEYYPYQK